MRRWGHDELWLQPGFPARIRDALLIGGIAHVLLPAVSLVPAGWTFWTAESYIAVHSTMEMFAVVVSALVFGVGWSAPREETPGPMVVLAAASLAIALLDFAHLLSWPGMPRFVTPSTTDKTLHFWLAARLMSAGSLAAVALGPVPWRMSTAQRRFVLAAALVYAACACGLILFAPEILPPMFVPGRGLTPLKIRLEYGIAIVYGLAAVALIIRRPQDSAFQPAQLLAAALILAASELAFTLYAEFSDKYSFVGHVYKVAAYYFLYRCVFVHAVRAPFAARAEAHARLQRQTEIFSTLIENLPVGVTLVDAELRFVAFNRPFLDCFDLPPEMFKIGDPFERFLRYNAERGEYGPGDIDALVRQRIEMAIDPHPQQFARERPNGRVIENRRVALRGGGFVTSYIDVTDARRRETDLEQARARLQEKTVELAETAKQLAAANVAKSMFLANMSHELRTPLNAILGFSEIMREARGGPLNARYRDYARDVHDAGQYLLRLINDILDTSKVEVGQLRLDKDWVEIADVIEECRRLLFDKALAGGVDIAIDLPEALPLLFADRLRIKQALLNILSNAVKFTLPGGRVSVSVAATAAGEDGMIVMISDTGIGMKPGDIPLALEAFRQIDGSFTRRYEGTGLGLPLAKTFIELHSGRLEIESEPNRGTTVRIWLPLGRSRVPESRGARS